MYSNNFAQIYFYFTGVLAVIQGDMLIQLFGKNQLLRMGENLRPSDINNIRTKLRSIARLLLLLQDKSQATHSLNKYFQPQYYDTFVNSVNDMARDSPQLGLTLGHYVKQLCHLNVAEAIKVRDVETETAGEQFLKLYAASWSPTVAAATGKRQRLNKINTEQLLPITEDLVKLTAYIKEQIGSQLLSLSDRTWLVKLCVGGLILFNKRRPMEVQDVKLSDFQYSLGAQEEREEIMAHLSLEERVVHGRSVEQYVIC